MEFRHAFLLAVLVDSVVCQNLLPSPQKRSCQIINEDIGSSGLGSHAYDPETNLRLFPDLSVSESGSVKSVSYFAVTQGEFFITFWEERERLRYKLKARIAVESSGENETETYELAQPVSVQKGWVMGIHHSANGYTNQSIDGYASNDWDVGDTYSLPCLPAKQDPKLTKSPDRKAVALRVTICADVPPGSVLADSCSLRCPGRSSDNRCGFGADLLACQGITHSARSSLRTVCETLHGNKRYSPRDSPYRHEPPRRTDIRDPYFPHKNHKYKPPLDKDSYNDFPLRRDYRSAGNPTNVFPGLVVPLDAYVSSISFLAERQGSFYVSFWRNVSSYEAELDSKVLVTATASRGVQTVTPQEEVLVTKGSILVVHYSVSQRQGVVQLGRREQYRHGQALRDFDDGWERGKKLRTSLWASHRDVAIYVTLCACVDGYKWKKGCNTECDDGTYGPNCAFNCSNHNCQNGPCNKATGRCDYGCEGLEESPFCLPTQQCTGHIIAIVLMATALLILLAVVVMCCITSCIIPQDEDEETARKRAEIIQYHLRTHDMI